MRGSKGLKKDELINKFANDINTAMTNYEGLKYSPDLVENVDLFVRDLTAAYSSYNEKIFRDCRIHVVGSEVDNAARITIKIFVNGYEIRTGIDCLKVESN